MELAPVRAASSDQRSPGSVRHWVGGRGRVDRGISYVEATALLPEPSPLSTAASPVVPETPPLVLKSALSIVESPPVSSEPVSRSADLPNVLSPADAARYAQAFDLQAIGASARADKVVRRIDDKLLQSHILADRYIRQARPRYSDLTKWLRQHRSHPDAPRIYQLARQYRPKKVRAPVRPIALRKSIAAEQYPPPPYSSRKNLRNPPSSRSPASSGKRLGSIRELYALVIECLERQEVGLWTARVSKCGFRRRAG